MALSATIVTLGPGIARAADASATLRPPRWDVGAVRFESLEPAEGGLTVAGTGTYRGAIEVRRHGRSLAVVNEVGTEDYLRGIDEVPSSWPSAALQAQAVAARTYAAHLAASNDASPWREVEADICATDSCQVYHGLDAETRAAGTGWTAAVKATAGRVLLAGNQPIRASYTASTSGPRTMSQEGARELAVQGRSAAQILGVYYDGLRPTLAPDRVPTNLRVAVTMASSSVRISATGPFRVVDGGGAELAAWAAGEWRIVPSGQGVRVVPPESHLRYLSLTVPAVPVDTATATATPMARVVRRPARVLTAAVPAQPGRGSWVLVAGLFVLLSGTAAVSSEHRRRRRWPTAGSAGT